MDDKKVLRKNLYILIFLNLSLFLFALFYTLYFNFIRDEGEGFKCAFQNLFMLYCPGCGGTRSLSALLELDFLNSFILYPPILISSFVIIEYDTRLFLSLIFKNKRFTDSYKFYTFLIIPVSIILNFLIRNILLIGFRIDTLGDFIH